MVLLELFWSFLKIGFTSFGGLSMIPLINDEVLSHGWMTASEVADIVAIAEMTPGPLGFNCATFAGIQAAGIPGAIAANLGVMSPTLTLCAAAAVFFERVKGNKYMEHILVGVRPACLGMVVGVTCSMLTNYLETSGSALFAYAVLKGVRLGYLPKRYAAYGEKAFYGTCDRHLGVGADGALQLGGICLVAGLGGATRRDGSLAYYFSEPIVENDAKGVGPLLLAYTEILAAQKQ